GVLAEQDVGDRVGTRVEGAGAFEFQQLRIGLLGFGHRISASAICKYYYASHSSLSTTNRVGYPLGNRLDYWINLTNCLRLPIVDQNGAAKFFFHMRRDYHYTSSLVSLCPKC